MSRTVETDFEWPLDNGAKVIVEASGTYYGDGGAPWPVTVAILTHTDTEGNTYENLIQAAKELGRIREHAEILIEEKGRDQMKESEAS